MKSVEEGPEVLVHADLVVDALGHLPFVARVRVSALFEQGDHGGRVTQHPGRHLLPPGGGGEPGEGQAAHV